MPVRLALAALVLLLLAGCGGKAPPDVSLTCTTHRAPQGRIAAAVTVTNQLSTPRSAVVFGPAVLWLRHISPVLPTDQVVLVTPHSRASFVGYRLTVQPNHPAHLRLRFIPPPQPRYLDVSDRRVIHAAGRRALANPSCIIRRLP